MLRIKVTFRVEGYYLDLSECRVINHHIHIWLSHRMIFSCGRQDFSELYCTNISTCKCNYFGLTISRCRGKSRVTLYDKRKEEKII